MPVTPGRLLIFNPHTSLFLEQCWCWNSLCDLTCLSHSLLLVRGYFLLHFMETHIAQCSGWRPWLLVMMRSGFHANFCLDTVSSFGADSFPITQHQCRMRWSRRSLPSPNILGINGSRNSWLTGFSVTSFCQLPSSLTSSTMLGAAGEMLLSELSFSYHSTHRQRRAGQEKQVCRYHQGTSEHTVHC